MERYGTDVQAAADNMIQHMRLAGSATTATDTHSPYTMSIAVGYMRTLNVTLDLHCCRVTISRVSKLINFRRNVFWGLKRPVHWADKFTTLLCRLSSNLRAWSTQVLSGFIQGFLYLYLEIV